MVRASALFTSERVLLEDQLIRAFDQVEESDIAITAVLKTFDWDEHRELACLGLAEITRRQPGLGERKEVAAAVTSYCRRALGPYCDDCPVRKSRAG